MKYFGDNEQNLIRACEKLQNSGSRTSSEKEKQNDSTFRHMAMK